MRVQYEVANSRRTKGLLGRCAIKLACVWLSVCVVIGLGVWPISAQEMSPDTRDQPADSVVEPADTVLPMDTDGQPNGATLQSPDASGKSNGTCSAAQSQATTIAIQGRPLRPTPKPGPGNTVVPLLCRPFTGEYSTADFFDHDLPFEFVDKNGYQLTWWGLKIWPTVDGHNGYDWSMPEGTPVFAAAPGTVAFAGFLPTAACPTLGRDVSTSLVSIEHVVNTPIETRRIRSMYYHLSRIDVQAGQVVAAGDSIGLSGNVGCSGGPHLHFQTNIFAKGRFIPIDPYGWDGPGPDPWAQHAEGTQSLWLWQDDQAPPISYRDIALAPNFRPTDRAPVALTYIRFLGPHDDQYPNNEFLELTLDPRYAPSGSYDLSGHVLRNNQGDSFTFPAGFQIHQGAIVRIYVGSGQDTPTTLYWGRSTGIWNPMGDCVRLVLPDGNNRYRLATPGGSCN